MEGGGNYLTNATSLDLIAYWPRRPAKWRPSTSPSRSVPCLTSEVGVDIGQLRDVVLAVPAVPPQLLEILSVLLAGVRLIQPAQLTKNRTPDGENWA